ncbi:MAG: hypothetical protein RL235_917 [Chlamydiota bacterium]|jgi:TrmH family RNA methyltransferase
MFDITSAQNPKIKKALALRDRKGRDETRQFLIEGYRELKRAIDARHPIDALFVCPELFLKDNERALIDAIDAPKYRCSPEVFAKIAYRDRPDGLIAVAPEQRKSVADFVPKSNKAPFLLIAESIEKPGNLGTILRSADAAGVDAVIVCDPTTDIYNPNVVRSSVGTLFTVPVFEGDARATMAMLNTHNIAIAAATPHATIEFTQADFTVPLAIVVGTEQYGLSELWMQQATLQVRIPMFGIADSLNVASATTLLLYEVVRQRRLLLR